MSFREHIQERAPRDPLKNSDLAMPTSPKFKVEHWRQVFGELTDGSAEDANTLEVTCLGFPRQ